MYQIYHRRNFLSNGTQPHPVLTTHYPRPVPVFGYSDGNTEWLQTRFEDLQVCSELRVTAVDRVADRLRPKGDGVEDVGGDGAKDRVRKNRDDRVGG